MHAAFTEIVDYAGLFPPASLSMADSVREYDRYRRSPDRWMLGRFVVAAIRLQELGAAILATETVIPPDDPWELSVAMGAMVAPELVLIADFERTWNDRGVVATAVECRVNNIGETRQFAEQIPYRYQRFFEVPKTGPYEPLVREIAAVNAWAKYRTGGTTHDYFPAPADLAAFLTSAVRYNLPFKATAGLHHPLRGTYPLSYQPNADLKSMYGFVALLLATTEAMRRGSVDTVQAILEDPDHASFSRDVSGYRWRDRAYSLAELTEAHQRFFISFGCCSFREPVDELDLGAVA